MAIEVRFNCSEVTGDFLITGVHPDGGFICIGGKYMDNPIEYIFDIPTAIKFSKTIRTEINKAKEVKNG